MSIRQNRKSTLTKAKRERMKFWYDACTGKHMRYGAAIAKHLRKAGHEIILTTREHPDTLALAQALGEKPLVIGKYSPSSLFTRLDESASRTLQFSKLFRDNLPDAAIAHQSVELCRTAFGLGVPIVLTADTPHAIAVNKLTIPLASTVVTSEAIPKNLFKKFGAWNITRFKGVDEVAWIKSFKPPKKKPRKPQILIRQMETRAAYALGKDDDTAKIAQKLQPLGDVLFVPRYDRTGKAGTIDKNQFVDTAKAAANADLVVSVGGTISREAALQGVPSIAVSEMGRTYVNKYLAKKGFPLFMVKSQQVLDYAKKYIGQRFDVKEKLAEFEDPAELVSKIATQSVESKC